MKYLNFLVILIFLLLKNAFSDRPIVKVSYTISGYVFDKESGEILIGANVYDKNSLSGTSTNKYGFYSLTLPSDSILFVYNYVGYIPFEKFIDLNEDKNINIYLTPKVYKGEEILSEAERYQSHVHSTEISRLTITQKQAQSIPVLFGETDIFKAAQQIPGIQAGKEGTNNIYVRGSSHDQNLILLDGIPVYNHSHLFGFFSIFNMDAVRDLAIYKGNFPARFGGRLSSAIDISLKEGNLREYVATTTLGIASSRFTFEGPFIKDKASFFLSGRKSYLNAFVWKYINKDTNIEDYDFYDLNLKLNYKISPNDRLYLSSLVSDDDSKSGFLTGINSSNFGNTQINLMASLRWNHIWNNKIFSNLNIGYSSYLFDSFNSLTYKDESNPEINENTFQSNSKSEIKDVILKFDLEYSPLPSYSIKSGIEGTNRFMNPGMEVIKISGDSEIDTTFNPDSEQKSFDYAAYMENEISFSDNCKSNAGIRLSGFRVDNNNYFYAEPRISLLYLLGKDWSVKTAYSRTTQFLHMLTNAGQGVRTDLWVPATSKVLPEKADQIALSLNASLFESEYDFTVETYFKKMQNLVEYKEGASFYTNTESWQSKATIGEGTAWGVEVMLKKNKGSLKGWLGYTLSNSERDFNDLNRGKPYPFIYEQKHTINFLSTYSYENWEFSLSGVYHSGLPATLPRYKYVSFETPETRWSSGGLIYWNFGSGNITEYIDSRNDVRMSSYHRMDASVSYKFNFVYGELSLKGGYFNLYNRTNPYLINFYKDNYYDNYDVEEIGLLSGIPFLSLTYKWNFK